MRLRVEYVLLTVYWIKQSMFAYKKYIFFKNSINMRILPKTKLESPTIFVETHDHFHLSFKNNSQETSSETYTEEKPYK